ncbi:L-lactate dehydrogenase [Lactobacillus sp. DCY120]|uniref:L-lactate dehydrogenase n=1 Tax=Bombilactobacillus apium TaxID=2675299 RepID=A0A850QZW6_9LACO|nr:L-lactate dehydrogenase [Bombilactobacillus apium]NVY96233.1 L-lactate dehydrogenase [Bombilactobacillus apium]
MNFAQPKIMLVGAGAVGSSFAFSLLQTYAPAELMIVDVKADFAQGNVWDLEDLQAFSRSTKISVGTYAQAQDADIVVITAGVPRQTGETRLDLINKNRKILQSIIEPIVASGFAGYFVVSSNPVDILTQLTAELSGFDRRRVIGTGTLLDTARFKVALARKIAADPQGINAYVLGEHGDSSFVNFSEITVDGRPFQEVATLTATEKAELEAAVHQKGGKIIQAKGATFYGVARYLGKICQAILENQNLVLPVSAPLTGQYGLDNLYLGTPAILNNTGIAQVLEVPLTAGEQIKMQDSATQLQKILKDI